MDPIFSAGVYLASWSGKLAAETVIKSLENGKSREALFARYEKRVRRGLRFYWRVVEHYYTTPFMELFLRPSNHLDLGSAVNAVLAGELEGGWPLRWRLEYFFLLVKVQRHFRIVPPIFFGPRARKLNPIPRPQKT
jgi:FADH2-dependent halogenase